ncbi:MAG TPA: sugar transferase [Candidatus Acidoferrales bacterium]|nr:sugar transferase [Candidatus Acidoferrales bacterium]
MLTTADISARNEGPWPALPEQLRRNGAMLVAGDIACALLIIALLNAAGGGAAAFLALAATFAIGLATGRYRVSFAAQPHDEFYQAAAAALPGAAVAWVLALLLGLVWWSAPVAALIWTVMAGAVAMAFHKLRRGERRFDPALEGLRRQRARPSLAIELALIRFFDVVLASCAFVAGLPVLAAITFMVWRADGAPVYFRQRRVGCDDEDFTIVKFRTMRSNAGDAWVRPGDERITPTGAFLRRTSLDELPQLLNVLAGQMSLVGPRPEMHEYADRFEREIPLYSLRHLLRPGLTGWAQLHLPRNLDPSDAPRVLQYDLFYVEHVGIYLYSYCVIKTACELLSQRAV